MLSPVVAAALISLSFNFQGKYIVVPSGAVNLKSKSFTNTGVGSFNKLFLELPAGSVQQIVALNSDEPPVLKLAE